MKSKFYRLLRFNPLAKILFSNLKIDYFMRKFFMQKFFIKHYQDSSKNILMINNELNPILKKYKGFLGHGIALKIIREHTLPKNQDLDYDIYDYENVNSLIIDLINLGYELFVRGKVNNEDKFLTFYKDGSYIDFFICKCEKNNFEIHTVCCETIFPRFKKNNNEFISNKFISICRKMSYTDIMEYKFKNNLFYLPKNFEIYFNEMYGYDWREKKEIYNWAINPKNNLPFKIKGVSAIINKKCYLINYR